MQQGSLHPWLNTPEAVKAASRAVSFPRVMLAGPAVAAGFDDLFSMALVILTECALNPAERLPVACAQCDGSLDAVRAGAKFCSPKCRTDHKNSRRGDWRAGEALAPGLPATPAGHIGAMWLWPEDKRSTYAARQVGLALCNYLRSRTGRAEFASSHILVGLDSATAEPEPGCREVIEDFLIANDVPFDGTETTIMLGDFARALVSQGA
jgi:hypothetical protein